MNVDLGLGAGASAGAAAGQEGEPKSPERKVLNISV